MLTISAAIAEAGGIVGVGDIAKLAGVDPDTVTQWTRRHDALRALGYQTSGGWVWVRADAEAWLRKTGRLTPRPISPAST